MHMTSAYSSDYDFNVNCKLLVTGKRFLELGSNLLLCNCRHISHSGQEPSIGLRNPETNFKVATDVLKLTTGKLLSRNFNQSRHLRIG